MAALHCEKQWHEGKRAVGRFACLGIGAESGYNFYEAGEASRRDATLNMDLAVPLQSGCSMAMPVGWAGQKAAHIRRIEADEALHLWMMGMAVLDGDKRACVLCSGWLVTLMVGIVAYARCFRLFFQRLCMRGQIVCTVA